MQHDDEREETQDEQMAHLALTLCRFLYTVMVLIGVFIVLIEVFQEQRGAVYYGGLVVGGALALLGAALLWTRALPGLRGRINGFMLTRVTRLVHRIGLRRRSPF